ncbi:hypothetical protein AB0F17_34650 [Nonomuraea sp. NPDC026600]|uniref:AlbA family DNA-binding domain-containing protein n=1 Tax=Nonomuraea sp. NPDC026600 TaxID=3155363 RepID=UPI0033C5F3BE
MALNFDIRTAPVRPAEFVALADAVFDASAADESTWLEWKSTLDLRSKHGCHHIARAIVGFANRMPDVAASYTEGRAYLVVGVSPGHLPGVTPIDVVDLDQGLTPYLGKRGPRWRPTYVTLTRAGQTAQVLIVEVDAPRWGDRIFCMCKEFDGVPDGAIFVRVNGATRPPKSHEVEALGGRFRRGAQEVKVDLRVLEGTPVRPVDTGEDAAERWLAARRRDAMASLLAWEQPEPATPKIRTYVSTAHAELANVGKTLNQALNQALRTKPETRTPDEYRHEVEEYLQQCSACWPDLVMPGAASHIVPVELELANALPTNLAGVEVELYIPGDVRAVEPRPAHAQEANERFLRLPRPPRPYGPQKVPILSAALPGLGTLRPTYGFMQSGLDMSRPQIVNSGSTTITFPAEHLRPHERVRLDPIVLVVQAPAPSNLVGQWRATSTSMDGRFTGELSISVSDDPLPLTAILSEPATWRSSTRRSP